MIRIKYTNGQGTATGGSATNRLSLSTPVVDTFNTVESCDYLSPDGLGFDLSGTKKFYQTGDYAGIISSNLTTPQSRTLDMTITYTGDFSDLSTTGLFIEFYKNPVRSFTVVLKYGDTGTQTVYFSTDNPAVTRFHKAGSAFSSNRNYHTMTIQDIQMVNPNARAVIVNVAKVYTLSKGEYTQIKSHNLIEEINILSTDLPINQFETVVASQSKPAVDSKIAVYSNDKYYGTFWINEVEQVGKKTQYEVNHGEWIEVVTVGDDLYSITATNAVGLLERGSFRKWRTAIFIDDLAEQDYYVGWAGVRLSEMLADIQASTGVKVTSNESGYNANTFGLYGYVDRKSYRHNLCAAAFGLGYMIDGSRSDRLYFRKIPSSVTKTYTNADIVGTATFNKKPKVTQIEYYTYPEAKVEQIGELSGTLQPYSKDNTYWFALASSRGTDKYIDYELSSMWIVNTGVPEGTFDTFADRALYHTYSKTEWIRSPISVQPTIEMINVQKSSEENIEKYDYFSIQGVQNISTKPSSTFYFSTYEDAFTGTLISRATDVTKMAKSGGTVNAKVILTNEKIGDAVTIPTEFGEEVTGIITKMNIHFGYNDVADIEVTEYEI